MSRDPSTVVLMLQRLMAPLTRKVAALASRATIQLVDDSGRKQLIQITALADERGAQIERLQQYGFTANPPAGCSGLLISINGSRTHMLFIEGEDASRKKGLEPGESAQYSNFGSFILLDKNGNALVSAGTVTMTGNLHVEGNITCDHDVSDSIGKLSGLRDNYNDAKYPISGGLAGTTDHPDPS